MNMGSNQGIMIQDKEKGTQIVDNTKYDSTIIE